MNLFRNLYPRFGAVFAGLLIFLSVWQFNRAESPEEIQRGIAGEVLRFHVLANSDSEEDQNLKMEVKNKILDYLEPRIRDLGSREEVKAAVQDIMPELEGYAESLIQARGYDYPVKGEITVCPFPEKTYGDCTLPAGDYEALRLTIGKGEGKNWWCILFPGLCFTDCIGEAVPKEEKEELRGLLTDEEYRSIFSGNHSYTISFSWF